MMHFSKIITAVSVVNNSLPNFNILILLILVLECFAVKIEHWSRNIEIDIKTVHPV